MVRAPRHFSILLLWTASLWSHVPGDRTGEYSLSQRLFPETHVIVFLFKSQINGIYPILSVWVNDNSQTDLKLIETCGHVEKCFPTLNIIKPWFMIQKTPPNSALSVIQRPCPFQNRSVGWLWPSPARHWPGPNRLSGIPRCSWWMVVIQETCE